MNDEEIRKYLGRQTSTPAKMPTPRMRAMPRRTAPPRTQETFRKFSASHLLCPKCKQAMPVRERLMLVLPDGDLYDYICQVCGTSCGTKKAGN